MKKTLLLLLTTLAVFSLFQGCGKEDPNTLTILNYGKYIEPEVLDKFEAETGIKVEYEEYITRKICTRNTKQGL